MPTDRPPVVPAYEGRALPYPDEEVFDQGLTFDLGALMDRRRVLKVLGIGVLGAAVAACAPGAGEATTTAVTGSSSATAATTAPATTAPATTAASSATETTAATATTAAGAASCETIPEETAGPYPGDGSNGPDMLAESGVVRSDIRSSFGDLSGTAEGIPLTIEIAVQDESRGCAALAGAAVYAWHCDRDGEYSLYTLTDQNYLRGVQETGADGFARFTSIFPGCYSGRWPHIHFEVFPSLDAATDDLNKIATSQIALPEAACQAVYATDGYDASATNLPQITLQTDNVFGDDGGVSQLGTITGNVDEGYTVRLNVPVTT